MTPVAFVARLLPAAGLVLVVALSGVARGDELRLIGRHATSGVEGGRSFQGHVEVRPDATYAGVRNYSDGSVENVSGQVRIDQQTLVLIEGTPGMTGILGGASGGVARTYSRADDGRHVQWRYTDGGDTETLRQERKRETFLGLLWRMLRRGRHLWNYVVHDNRGEIDPNPAALILRSRQPSVSDLRRLVDRHGLRTVLSLNGDQDRELTDYMQSHGIRNIVLRMGASRAPSDAELLEAFTALLDDSLKPILVHCRGGADRTGVIGALYQIEFLGASKEDAKREMRAHLWAAHDGTEIQGAFVDMFQPGSLRALLQANGVPIPARFGGQPAPAPQPQPAGSP